MSVEHEITAEAERDNLLALIADCEEALRGVAGYSEGRIGALHSRLVTMLELYGWELS